MCVCVCACVCVCIVYNWDNSSLSLAFHVIPRWCCQIALDQCLSLCRAICISILTLDAFSAFHLTGAVFRREAALLGVDTNLV